MRALHRVLAMFAALAVSVISPSAEARSHQWANALVSAPSCLSNQWQNGTGNLYNACGSYIQATMPLIIDPNGGGPATVGAYVTGDSWCWITVVDQTSTNFYQGAQKHFEYQNQHTALWIPAPYYVSINGGETVTCQLAPNSYLFTVSY